MKVRATRTEDRKRRVVSLGKRSSVHLAVGDHGIGIAEKEIPQLFEAFYRSPAARQRGTSGQGLGLSVAARLARSFGGQLDAQSRPGQGSVFTLVLPADSNEMVDP